MQNRSYSASIDKFAPLNAVVYTVSTQDTKSKQEFCGKEGLTHTLLSDVGGKTASAYGVLAPNGRTARRVTFYIAPDGTVAAVDTKPKVGSAADDSLAMLTKLVQEKGGGKTLGNPVGADGGGPLVVKDSPNRLVGPAEAKVTMDALVPDFGLVEVRSGKNQALTTLAAGKKATAIIFISTQCPVSNAYNQRMASLYRQYSGRGVQFIGINSNSTEPTAAILGHANQHNLAFPILKDENNVIADRFEAQVTPEVFVTDAKGILVYHGPIDDSQNASGVKTSHLKNTLDAVLAGKPVPVKTARAFGCEIKRVAAPK